MTESPAIISAKNSSELTNAPIRILNVDDDPGFLKITKQILEVLGPFQVETAYSVDEAMEMMKKTTYDTIVSDYQMTGKSGLDFLKELRGSGNDVPFILFTGKGREEIAIEALNLGADGYFNKMGVPETVYGELAHGIRQAVERERAEEALRTSEEEYRSLFFNMFNGYAYQKIVLDEENKPVDFVYLEVNDAFERLTGLKKENVVGKRVTEVIPGRVEAHPELLEIFGRVALTGKSEDFVIDFKPLETWLHISVYSPKKEYIVTISEDITERKKVEEALKESEERFRSLFESTHDGIIVSDRDGVIISANYAAAKMLGFKDREELLGKTTISFYENPEQRKLIFKKLMKEGYVEDYEVKGKRKDGAVGYFLVSLTLHRDTDGNILRTQGTFKDITERKHTETALLASEEQYRNLFESSREGIAFSGPEGKIIRMNDAAAAMLGYDGPEELVDIPAVELYQNPEDREAMFKEIVVRGYVKGYELTLKKRDGFPIHVLCSGLTRRDEDGNILQTETFIRDITDRKKAEEAIEHLARFPSENPNPVLRIDKDGVILYANVSSQPLLEEWNYERGQLIPDQWRRLVTEGVNSDKRKTFEVEHRNRVFSFEISPVAEANYVNAYGRDITEKKKAEEAIRESREKLSRIFESINDGITVTDLNGIIVDVNERVLKLGGFNSKSDIIGKSALESIVPGDKERALVDMLDLAKSGVVGSSEYTLMRYDGSTYPAEISANVLKNAEGNVEGFVSIIRDVTERKRAEEELVRLSTAVKMSSDSIMISDLEGKIVYVNNATLKMYEAANGQDLIGKKVYDFVAPEDREKAVKDTREAFETGYIEGQEYTVVTKEGRRIPVELNASVMSDAEGKPMGFVGISRDITERKTREEEMKRRLMRFRLDDGNLYLVKESSPALSLEAFKDLLNVGYRGLVFSRTPEEEFKKNVDGTFEFRWLAEIGGEKSLPPKFEQIENSLEKLEKKSVVLLDCLDYLVLKNEFKETLFFVQRLRELSYLLGTVVILSVDPAALRAREIRVLEKETREVEPRILVRLPEDLLEILRFIYEHNALGSKPNYTEIREEVGISKPTVGKRIKTLVNTGYVMENVRGRSKVLELTQKGMRLFLK